MRKPEQRRRRLRRLSERFRFGSAPRDDGHHLHQGLLVHAVDHDGRGRHDGHLDERRHRATHNVTSTDGPGVDAATTSTFASETLSQGDTFSFTFEEPGTYYYECTIHASMATMHATVIVE